MYQLFQESPLDIGGGMIFPEFRRIRDGLQLSVRRIQQYRRNNPRYLPGGHLLIRLLQSIPVSQKLDFATYNDKVGDVALLVGQSFQLTSALSKGKVRTPGPFLGANVKEIVIANTDPWDLDEGLKDWQNLKPIRFLYHPMSNLKLPVPDGQTDVVESGVSVVTINIPMLMTQYLAWRHAFKDIDESPRSVGQFLQAYPIPNMLDSQLDLALVNRLTAQFFGTTLLGEPYRHPFYLTDWSSEVDQVLAKFLEQVGHKRWDFDTILSHIPTVCAEDLHRVIALPELAYTTQLQWAVLVARLALITFLVQFNRKTENERNQKYLNLIRRWLRYMDGNKTLKTALPADLYEDVQVLIQYGIEPYL